MSLITAIVTFAAFAAIAGRVMRSTGGALFKGAYSLQIDQAIDAYERGGAISLASFITRLDAALGMEHHLVNAEGQDLVTGVNRARLLTAEGHHDQAQVIDGRFVAVRASRDGRYKLIVSAVPPFSMATFIPFYVLVLVTVCVLSWFVALGIASPPWTMSATVERFGRGDLDARMNVKGKNEMARLSSAFNEMAERLQTLLVAERRLLQDVSHELRSPLARLSFAIELARTSEDRGAAVDRAQQQVDDLRKLVGELVEMTRAEGDPTTRANDSIVIADLVREVVSACAMDAEAQGSEIRLETTSSRTIHGDRNLLARACENVLRNAIRFTPRGEAVDVSVEERGTEVAVVIRDRGPGVPEQALPNLFNAFYRVDRSRDAGTGGLGLGLAIAYRAIHLHHGSIRAENDAPGLRVTITLPNELS